MNIYNVTLIYADGCKDCERMRSMLVDCIETYPIRIQEFESDSDEAVDFAVDNGINNIPACKIGEEVIQGDSFTLQQIKDALNEYCE